MITKNASVDIIGVIKTRCPLSVNAYKFYISNNTQSGHEYSYSKNLSSISYTHFLPSIWMFFVEQQR